MRKIRWFVAVCLLCVFCAGLALAEDGQRRTMLEEGTVVAETSVTVAAPFGGMLLDNTLKVGDMVQAGKALHEIDTTKVYAACDGIVGGVRAQPGDDAAAVQARYTALLYIEPASRLTISTSTRNAYDAAENDLIHVGETVYLRSTANRSREGVGFVTLVDGSNYTVEVTSGELELGETANIFREADFVSTSKIGSGKTARMADVAVTADAGVVYRVHVTQGTAVRRGDLLLEMVTGALAPTDIPSGIVAAPAPAIVATLDASAGSTVSQHQLLSTLYLLEDLQVKVQVSESDLGELVVGDAVKLEFDGLGEQANVVGTVASISGLSSAPSEDDADEITYAVYIDFAAHPLVRQGMTVKAIFNEEAE